MKDNEKASNEETENKDNVHEMDIGDNNSKSNFKKRKYSSEKSFVSDESDTKVKKKKKEAADQNTTDQQDERKKVSKSELEDRDSTCDNEIDATDNNARQNSKKRKYSEKSSIADESDIKVKKKKKAADQITTHQQNEKEKVEPDDKDNSYDNEIDAVHNSNRQSSKKEKYVPEKSLVADESDVKVKKRRRTADQITTDQQNEKEKLTPEKSCIKDEKDIKVTGNSNIENQESPSKNRPKITEKKKRRLTVNDTIIAEDISGEAVKKECQKPATNSNKNKTTEMDLHEGDESNEKNALLQTEKHSTSDFGTRNSDIEETSDERKKKKNRKKRSKIQDNDICSKIGLQIMAKSDWKRLRNRYLDLQRYKMSQLKVHLRKAEVERGGIMTKNGYHDKTGQNNTLHDKSRCENDNEKLEKVESCGRVNYAPGIIVKIEMDEPCTDLQSFKVYRYH